MNDWDLWKAENLENARSVIIPLPQALLAYTYSSHESPMKHPKWEPLLRVLHYTGQKVDTADSINLTVSPN